MLGVPATPEAIRLFHQGLRVMSEMTCNGFPVDNTAVVEGIAQCKRLCKELEEEAWKIDGGSVWKSRHGSNATLSNPSQAREIFYEYLGFPMPQDKDGDSDSMDKDALADIDHPLADLVSRFRKLEKCADTFLKSLLVEAVDGYVHPFFSLSQAISYRSSSTNPNGQNFPVRDPETAGYVRKAIKAPPGWRIVEGDYSGIEVLMALCYHRDPTMHTYLSSGYDMHRDMAAECYILDRAQEEYWASKSGKKTRYSSKNGFVFPEFYGSYWSQVAVSLWKNITRLDLKTLSGESLSAHLLKNGVKGLGTIELDDRGRPKRGSPGSFYRHIEAVEKNFWNERFPVYDQWRKDWYAAYTKKGHFQSLTGFNYTGAFRRNQVINLPVQGSASHMKLQALINMQTELLRLKMESRLILEIHDSVIGLVRDCEFESFCQTMQEQMVDKVNEQFPWLAVPVKIEIEASPVGGSWYEKSLVHF